jgi:hypothetical protein
MGKRLSVHSSAMYKPLFSIVKGALSIQSSVAYHVFTWWLREIGEITADMAGELCLNTHCSPRTINTCIARFRCQDDPVHSL